MNKRERLRRLRKFADCKWPNIIPYSSRRVKKYLAEDHCKVCEVRKADVKHHIIQIQFGGPDVWWNRIDICNQCHDEIHPWLTIKRQEKKMEESLMATLI